MASTCDASGRCTAGADGPVGPHGRPLQMPSGYVDSFVVGACDLESVEHSAVTREMLQKSEVPFLIKGLTADWKAHTRWARDEILQRYADEPFQLHASGNASLGSLLKRVGKYHMGHAVYPQHGCYNDPTRPYSPMLYDAFFEDYHLPSYLGPMVTFQMGVGTGFGIGVPPENHPASWFAVVKGKKRWVLLPPSAGTGKSGGPGTEPPNVMQGDQKCVPKNKPLDALHCDQQEGDVIWVPSYWWHETCGLEDFSIGLGALTYDGCCPEQSEQERRRDTARSCNGERERTAPFKSESYRITDIPACLTGEIKCGTLPDGTHHS